MLRLGNMSLRSAESWDRKRARERRQKRIKGLFSKADACNELCGLDVVVITFDPERRKFETYRSEDRVLWPPPMAEIVSDSL